jgi:ADP-ribosyl-[dinitrogen reductase] hydrolase
MAAAAVAFRKMTFMVDDALDRSRGCLIGLAVGDAVGTTVEFKRRDSFSPLTDMVGGGPFDLDAGEWTDDTSMALCLATSLVERRGFDPVDQMNRYCNWYLHGVLSSNGECFDIGLTVRSALDRYLATKNPYAGQTDPQTAGNGSLMRLAPVPIFYRNPDIAEQMAADSSRTTHGAHECIDACRILTRLLISALSGANREVLLASAKATRDVASMALVEIVNGGYATKQREDIKGTGYVVHSLEAALWSFATTTNFRDAVLMAANLGDDADTTAAICGQVAGAHYGMQGIPTDWLAKLKMRGEIIALADRLHQGA